MVDVDEFNAVELESHGNFALERRMEKKTICVTVRKPENKLHTRNTNNIYVGKKCCSIGVHWIVAHRQDEFAIRFHFAT